MKTVPFACVALFGCSMVWGQQPVYYERFEDEVPAYFVPSRAESLSLSPWHSKEGKRSLRWDWSGEDEVVIHHGIGDLSRVGGLSCKPSFAVWVYIEEPIADALLFEFREKEEVTGSFRFPLDFTGWRQARVFYDGFPAGRPTAKVDNIRVAAPTNVAKGTVFLDFIKYNTLSYPSFPIIPEKAAQWRRPVPDEGRFPKPVRVADAEMAGIRKLLGPDEGPGIDAARVSALCERVKALGIVKDEHGIHGGPGLNAWYQYCCKVGEFGYKDNEYCADEHGLRWPPGMMSHPELTSLAAEVAEGYRASRDAEQRHQLAEAFLLLEDYLFDQGMQAGSGFLCNWWYGTEWADAVFQMRDVLDKAGRLARQTDYLVYNYGGGEIFAEADPPSHMDFYLLDVPRLFRACLMQVEATEQARWLRAFKAMLERSILQPTSSLKIDGCTYHHGGHYFAYAGATIPRLAGMIEELSDTPWRLSAEAHERVRRAMLAERLFCNQRDLPLSLSGRRPNTQSLAPEGLDLLARSGTPDGKQPVDREVAAAYLRLVPEAIKQEPYRRLGLKPEPDPNGTYVMPYGALLSHRRGNWLASIHGQSKYCWGTEREGKVNCFGLFQGLGSLEILAVGNPVSAQASGRELAGWDWRRYEGTTVPQLPLERIDKEWTSALSPETCVGGLSHRGRQGLFAMIVNQAMPGQKTLKGRKSWFFSDDRILCLGSDLSCDEADYPTQTTLCQKHLPKNDKAEFVSTRLDGADLTAFPEERSLDEAKPHWFLDTQQTGYYLPAGQRVIVARTHQKSREYRDLEDTEGDFLTAWIDHGRRPTAASYEYMLAVRSTPEAMRRIAAEPPYRVIQRNQAAHIVWDNVGRRWGCVFFVPQEITARTVAAETLPVRAVDRPCLVMAEAVQHGRIVLSLADPDLNLEKGVNQPRPLRVTLHGAWRLLDATATVGAWQLPDGGRSVRVLSTNAAQTVLEITCQHGASYGLTLAR